MNTGREGLRKMMLAVVVLAACSWFAPSLFAQTGTDPPAAGRTQKPAAKAERLRSSLPAEKEKAVAQLGRLPMSFEENRGQTDSRVKFLSRGRGYTLFLTEDEAVVALRRGGFMPPSSGVSAQGGEINSPLHNAATGSAPAVLRMRLAGANDKARISGEEQLPGKIYYASGKETGPLQGNATYQRVKYAEVYPGIDLEYYGNSAEAGRLEFDFVVAPRADPKQIRLAFSGAEKIKLTEDGELSLRVSGEEVRLKKPAIYQERDGRRTEIAGGYRLTGKDKRDAVFDLAAYDPSLPLVIDPQIEFATYLGGAGSDGITDVRVLATGEIYVLAWTEQNTGFPTTQILVPPAGGGMFPTDCFVSKLSADGSTLLYSVGFQSSWCFSMAVEPSGRVHLSHWYGLDLPRLETLVEDSTGAISLQGLQGGR